MNKLYRLSLSLILMFGWLFLVPAQGDPDPLTKASEDIAVLEENINNLTDKESTQYLLNIAKEKYADAVQAKENLDNSQIAYDAALSEKQSIEIEKTSVQNAINEQQIVRDAAYEDLQQKQETLNIANINLAVAQSNSQGSTNSLNAYLYNCYDPWNTYNNMPPLGCGQEPIAMGPWSNINFNFGSGGPAGLYDDYQIKWTGYIKSTQHWTPQFRTCGDDGMILIISGNIVRNDWFDRGGGCAGSTGYYMESNGWLPIEVWWYENGGGANGQLQWNIGNGFTAVPSNVFSTSIPQQDPGLALAVDEQTQAQEQYNLSLETYNAEDAKLVQYNKNLVDVEQNLEISQSNLTLASENLTKANNDYEVSITEMQTAILNAQQEYTKQFEFEEKQRIAAAIAQALANQPKPEPSPEPTPTPELTETPETKPSPTPTVDDPTPSQEPTPEKTEPSDPTPTPDSETTNEPKPDQSSEPEPSPEPSPLPTDKDPNPTPQPEITPAEPSEESSDNSTTADLSRVIANLTSKDNIVAKLTPEQMAAVSNTLSSLSISAKVEVAKDFGIKTDEVAVIAELAADNPAVAAAVISFAAKAAENVDAPMPYTLADAITEAATEQFLSDPLGALTNIDFEKILNPSEWGKDMTDDQREKAQEVVIPVVIASNIVAAAMTRRI